MTLTLLHAPQLCAAELTAKLAKNTKRIRANAAAPPLPTPHLAAHLGLGGLMIARHRREITSAKPTQPKTAQRCCEAVFCAPPAPVVPCPRLRKDMTISYLIHADDKHSPRSKWSRSARKRRPKIAIYPSHHPRIRAIRVQSPRLYLCRSVPICGQSPPPTRVPSPARSKPKTPARPPVCLTPTLL